MRTFRAANLPLAVAVTMMATGVAASPQTEAKPQLPGAVSAGASYGDARQALLDAGWRPLPIAEYASNMASGFEKLCQTLPETEACTDPHAQR